MERKRELPAGIVRTTMWSAIAFYAVRLFFSVLSIFAFFGLAWLLSRVANAPWW